MFLFILLGVAIFTLIYAGSKTQERILEEKDIKSNAKIAAAYIDVKFKKYDEEGMIFIAENPITNENALVFKDEFNPHFTNDDLYTWVFFEDGILYTQALTDGQELESGIGIEIAHIEDFKVSIDKNIITSDIKYIVNNQIKTLNNVTVVRSLD